MNNVKVIRNIIVKIQNKYLVTIGLKKLMGFEIRLLLKDRDNEQYAEVLKYLIDYFIDFKPSIKDLETIAYHSWILKFMFMGDMVDLFEAQANGGGFTEGVDHAIKVVAGQRQFCLDQNSPVIFPLFNQMIVISDGILDGGDVDGVRYTSPSHMTGWWLTNDLYKGDVKTLKTIHYYHIAFARPDIIKYLALPFGFRFFSGAEDGVWFDESALS